MSSIELLRILSKQWADVNDIKQIASCGRDNASQIRDIIVEDITKSGKKLPNCKSKLVPMTSVIDYFNIDINHIVSMAENEKLLKI